MRRRGAVGDERIGGRGAERRRGAGPSGDALDRLLGPGQFVVVEPDMSEFVCSDRRQMLQKREECERRGIEPMVRWRRTDGTVERYPGRPPGGWGLESGPGA